MSSYFNVKSLVFASTSLVFLSGSALGQEGVCFIDIRQQGSPCVCLSEPEFDAFRPDGDLVLCELPDATDRQLSRLNFTDPVDPIDPVDPVDPVDPTDPNANRFRNNGIGNGLQDAPGNSDVTNGDAADGEDSGRGGPAGADGTAANGDAAGAGNNGNGNGNGNGNNS